jgi:hypothetical protein
MGVSLRNRGPRYLSAALLGLLLSQAAVGGEPDALTEDEARVVGRRVVEQLSASLKAELMQAIRKGGPVAAINVCAGRAQVLTAEIAAKTEVAGLALKRTSLRVRNQANLPDDREKQILAAYAQSLAAGEKLEHRLESTDEIYRYVAPIRVQGLCLACHGARESMAPEVQEIIAEHYPKDMAVGYASGDLRGIFSVVIPRKAPAPVTDEN